MKSAIGLVTTFFIFILISISLVSANANNLTSGDDFENIFANVGEFAIEFMDITVVLIILATVIGAITAVMGGSVRLSPLIVIGLGFFIIPIFLGLGLFADAPLDELDPSTETFTSEEVFLDKHPIAEPVGDVEQYVGSFEEGILNTSDEYMWKSYEDELTTRGSFDNSLSFLD